MWGALFGAAALAAVVVPASPASASTAFGQFSNLAAGDQAGMNISGVAVLHRTSSGTTGKIVVIGLQPGVTYAAHLHTQACTDNMAGGHYRDVASGAAAPPNELWFSTTSDPTAGITANLGGVAVGRGSADWVARSEAKAIVIHMIPTGGTTAGGPKIACADLA